MSDVTVVGAGAMGSAIARRFLAGGMKVSIWNRTPARAQALSQDGAVVFADLPDALRASEVIVVCVIDYDVSAKVFGQPGIADALTGRSVIQLTGGTPENAAKADTWMQEHGVTYLDGAIMCYPGDLGQDGSQVLIAGAKAEFDKWINLLSLLAQDLRYVGSNIRAAKTLDMALLARFAGLKFSAMHSQAKSKGINSDLPDLFLRWCKVGSEQGWGNLDNACLIKVLRGSVSS